jgi:hypothetical protein
MMPSLPKGASAIENRNAKHFVKEKLSHARKSGMRLHLHMVRVKEL